MEFRWPDIAAPCASLPAAPLAAARTPAQNPGFSTWEGDVPRETDSLLEGWRETNSNRRSGLGRQRSETASPF